MKINFVWYGSLGYSETGPVRSASIKFEQLNIVHNIAAFYTQLAMAQTGDDDTSIKLAFKYFQEAAGCFRYIITDLLPKLDHAPPLDLDTNTHETLYYICLAQAQEFFWKKAVRDGVKNTLISRLSKQVSEYYNEAITYANRSPSIQTEWIHHLKCKKFHFQAASQYRASVECLEHRRYGEEIARLIEARDACVQALMDSKYVSKDVLDDLQGLQSRVKSDLERAEKDNNMIYLQTVPAANTLASINAISMSKALLPSEVQNPIGFIEDTKREELLFTFILPYAIYQASNAYSEKLVNYVETNIVMEANNISNQMEKLLEELGLPGSLEAVEKPEGIPSSLTSYVIEVQDKGGIGKIRESLDDVSKLALESGHILDEGVKVLEYEENEDEMLREEQGRSRWTREKSRVAGKELWEYISQMRELQAQAANGDKVIISDFQRVERHLEAMSRGPDYVARFIPNSTRMNSSGYLDHVMQELKEALMRARGMINRRKEQVNVILQKASKADMLGEIIDEYNVKLREGAYKGTTVEASSFESIFLRHLQEFEKQAGFLEDDKRDQKVRIQKIRELNDEFLNARENDEGTVERENSIHNLEIAYHTFTKILGHLEEARKFYNNFILQLEEFVKKCKEFVYTRRMEGRQLEASIMSGFQQMSISEEGPSRLEDEGISAGSQYRPQNMVDSPVIPGTPMGRSDVLDEDSTINTPTPSGENSQRNRLWTPDMGIRFN